MRGTLDTTRGADILERIVDSKREEIARLRPVRRELARASEDAPPARPVLAPMAARPTVAVFAEVKRRSPGAGPIAPDLDPMAISAEYEAGGAQAVSVLTDGPWFEGSLADLKAVSRARRIPVLRKDFVLDEVQIWEARAAGADMVLLIVRILDAPLLADLRAMTHELGMVALVEVHDEQEIDAALKAGARMVGINNRDLSVFRTSLQATERLAPRIPDDVTVVSESGIRDGDDVRRAAAAGADAVLVGEALVRSHDPRGIVAEMAAVPKLPGRSGRPGPLMRATTSRAGANASQVRANASPVRAKVCGVTTPQDAAVASEAGADYLGAILSPGYVRSVSPERAAQLYAVSSARRVGVFVDAPLERVVALARQLSLHVVQLHGRETPEAAAQLAAAGPWKVWKSFHATADGGPPATRSLARRIAPYEGAVAGVLVDAWDPRAPGGTGRSFGWRGVGPAVRNAAGAAAFVAAGGMTPANAAAAIESLSPCVLDASSGLESAPGVKDPAKVRAFVTAVRHASPPAQPEVQQPAQPRVQPLAQPRVQG